MALSSSIVPFMRIGGKHAYPLPILAQLQTDGSFRAYRGYVAMHLTRADSSHTKQMFEILGALNSTEMEWASVAKGLEFALEQNQDCIGIENDNLGVISCLITQSRPKHAYARHYKAQIMNLANQTLWTGVRWIPRKINRADDLFRTVY